MPGIHSSRERLLQQQTFPKELPMSVVPALLQCVSITKTLACEPLALLKMPIAAPQLMLCLQRGQLCSCCSERVDKLGSQRQMAVSYV